MTREQLHRRILDEIRTRGGASSRADERAARRLIARAGVSPGRARYLARQAAVLQAATAAGPPLGTD
jgi:hypothetical protein